MYISNLALFDHHNLDMENEKVFIKDIKWGEGTAYILLVNGELYGNTSALIL